MAGWLKRRWKGVAGGIAGGGLGVAFALTIGCHGN